MKTFASRFRISFQTSAAAATFFASAVYASSVTPPAATASANELVVSTDCTLAPAVFLNAGSTDPLEYEASTVAEIAESFGVKATYRCIHFRGNVAASLTAAIATGK